MISGNRFVDTIQQFIKGPRNYAPPKVREFLFNYGNNIITDMMIVRTPIYSIFKSIIDMVATKYYDELYHLYMVFKLDNNKFFFIEKNEVVRIVEIYNQDFINDQTEYIIVDVKKLNLTMNTLLYNAQSAIGKNKLWIYSAINANCQDFIYSLLFYSKVGDINVYNFIKQDVEDIVSNTTSNIFDFITNTASRLDILIYGSAFSPLFF